MVISSTSRKDIDFEGQTNKESRQSKVSDIVKFLGPQGHSKSLDVTIQIS